MRNLFFLYLILHANILSAQNMADPQLIPYLKGDKWGYCNQAKELVIPAKYEEATFFSRDSSVSDGLVFWYASVKSNGKYGAINAKGELFIPAQYAIPIHFRQGFCWFMDYESKDAKAERLSIINYKNRKIFSSNKRTGIIREFNEGLLAVSLEEGDSYVGSLGFIDYQGKVVIPFQYDGNSPVSDFVFQNGRAALSKNNKMGIIDKDNKIIYPFTIENAFPGGHFFEKDGTGHIFVGDGSILIIDAEGKLLRKEKNTDYDTLRAIPNSNNFIKVKMNGDNLSPSLIVVDKGLNPVSQNVYINISEFIDGKAIAQKYIEYETGYGIIDTDAKEITPFVYSRIYPFGEKLLYIEKPNGQCGFMDAKTLSIQIPPIYNGYKSYLLESGLILMEKTEGDKHRYFLVNRKGEEIKEIEGYEWVDNGFNNKINLDNYFLVRKNNQYSILDSRFVEILPYYEEIDGISIDGGKHLLVMKNNKYGVVTLKNEILVPFEYDKIETSAMQYQYPYIFAAQKNGKDFYIRIPNTIGGQIIEYYEE